MELAKLKALLGIEDDSKDVVLEFVIADVEETIKNYCHVEEMPAGLVNTGYRMAMDLYRNENIGSHWLCLFNFRGRYFYIIPAVCG